MSRREIAAAERRRLMTLREAADLCAVDYDTMLAWVRKGALTCVEVGPCRSKRVYAREVQSMIREVRPAE